MMSSSLSGAAGHKSLLARAKNVFLVTQHLAGVSYFVTCTLRTTKLTYTIPISENLKQTALQCLAIALMETMLLPVRVHNEEQSLKYYSYLYRIQSLRTERKDTF